MESDVTIARFLDGNSVINRTAIKKTSN